VTALLHRLRHDQRGAALIEFAMLLPIMLLMLGGLVDGSRLLIQVMQLHAAAQAGVDWAQAKGWDRAGVEGAVRAATPLAPTVTASLVTRCVSGRRITAAPGPICADGTSAGGYVAITVTDSFEPLMPWPEVITRRPLQASSLARLT
jgi:Flp pilus assembly protein TadG